MAKDKEIDDDFLDSDTDGSSKSWGFEEESDDSEDEVNLDYNNNIEDVQEKKEEGEIVEDDEETEEKNELETPFDEPEEEKPKKKAKKKLKKRLLLKKKR